MSETGVRCPCCSRLVRDPTIEVIIGRCGVRPMEARVLTAVWRGKGLAVPTKRIFDAMYEDDINGGPSDAAMYRAFKVTLRRLHKRLAGTGVSIETVGYREGYRLIGVH